jgi:hypothetical protein
MPFCWKTISVDFVFNFLQSPNAMPKPGRNSRLKMIWEDLRPFVEALRDEEERDLAEYLALMRDNIAMEIFHEDSTGRRTLRDDSERGSFERGWSQEEPGGCARCDGGGEGQDLLDGEGQVADVALCERCALGLTTH